MELTEFIAAVDLGTSKIVGIVGKKKADGSLSIHAIEKEDSDSCIKRGCIQNVDETASKVKRLITKLENRARCKIGKIYVGLGGQSLQSIDHKVSRQLNEETPITDQIISSLKEVSMQMPVGNKEILQIVPSEYQVDGKRVGQPVGVYGSEIEATHKIILGRPVLKKNLNRVLEKIQIPLAGYILSPLASASVLSEPEKSLGCVLVDFGAATTTVSIYKDGLLRHLAVIPLGGNTITKDIASLQLLENEAEKVKIYFGNAAPEIDESENKVIKHAASVSIDSPEIQIRTLHQVVLCRAEEIIENISNQLRIAGYDSKQLSVGFILTGGASNMKGLAALLKKKTDMEVKIGSFQRPLASAQYAEIGKDTAYSVLLGLLLRGENNCSKEIQPEPVQIIETHQPEPEKVIEQPKKREPFQKLGGFLIDIFKDDKDTKLD
ncbi:MAG: cell division protein FtsA [Bacteroidales bacterium]